MCERETEEECVCLCVHRCQLHQEVLSHKLNINDPLKTQYNQQGSAVLPPTPSGLNCRQTGRQTGGRRGHARGAPEGSEVSGKGRAAPPNAGLSGVDRLRRPESPGSSHAEQGPPFPSWAPCHQHGVTEEARVAAAGAGHPAGSPCKGKAVPRSTHSRGTASPGAEDSGRGCQRAGRGDTRAPRGPRGDRKSVV